MIARNVILAFRPVQKAFDAYERELEAFAAASRATDERREYVMSNARMYFHGVMDKAVLLYERTDEEREAEKAREKAVV